jgi:hypothetical protein
MNNKDPFISELERQKGEEEKRALRYNQGKLKWSLVDWKCLEPMVEVLEVGAQKYESHNWKKGLPVTEVSESLIRHMFAFMNGEDNDPESGKSHLGHVMCNAMFLIYTLKEKPQFDDRYEKRTDK